MVHGIGDLWAERHELRSNTGRRASAADVIIRKFVYAPGDIEIKAGIPVLSVEATLADLVATGHELQHVADAYSDALEQKKVRSRKRLAKLLDRSASERGMATGADLLAHITELAA